jgi:hypothetical protein
MYLEHFRYTIAAVMRTSNLIIIIIIIIIT